MQSCNVSGCGVSRVILCFVCFCFVCSQGLHRRLHRGELHRCHLRTEMLNLPATCITKTCSPLQIMHEGYIADGMLTIGGCDKTVSASSGSTFPLLEKLALGNRLNMQHAYIHTRTRAHTYTCVCVRPGAGGSDADPSTQQHRTHALRRNSAPRPL